MEFCKCGSLIINGSCTNKKCEHHIKTMIELATPQQIEYIKELADQLADDISEINFDTLSKSEAVDLIDEYLEKIEDAEKKLSPDTALLDDDDIEEEL
jgi:superfamily II DNA/RNA helicase